MEIEEVDSISVSVVGRSEETDITLTDSISDDFVSNGKKVGSKPKKVRKVITRTVLSSSKPDESSSLEVEKAIGTEKRQRKRKQQSEENTDESTKVFETVTLLAHQIDHVACLEQILSKQYFALDLSPMGTGKTFCATEIWKKLGFTHVVVIAPVSVLPKWTMMKTVYGLPVRQAVSFCSLRSVKCHQPKHGLLQRVDKLIEALDPHTGLVTRTEKVEFHVTAQWKKLVEEGTLLVVDEIQNVKNVSSQFHCVRELVEEIRKQHERIHGVDVAAGAAEPSSTQQQQPVETVVEVTNNVPSSRSSKVLLLSGTPIDKAEQVINLYRATGVLHRNLGGYNPIKHSCYAGGYRDVLTFHESFIEDPGTKACIDSFYNFMEKTKRHRSWVDSPFYYMYHVIVPSSIQSAHKHLVNYESMGYDNGNENNFVKHIYGLFRDVFCQNMASAMRLPSNVQKVIKRNAYYYIPQEQRGLLLRGVSTLRWATQYDETTGDIDISQGGLITNRAMSFANISKALRMIETAKIPMFVSAAREALRNHPQQKVVICVNYTDTIHDLVEMLKEFNPLVVRGSTNMYGRQQSFDAFQQANVTHRLLIGNVQCLSTGVDLDDKDGTYPRIALVSPNYSTITLHQLSYRFLRATTQSEAEVHFVFGRMLHASGAVVDGFDELPILHALSKKSKVMREVSSAVRQHFSTSLSLSEEGDKVDHEISADDPTTIQEDEIKYPGEFDTWQDPDIRPDVASDASTENCSSTRSLFHVHPFDLTNTKKRKENPCLCVQQCFRILEIPPMSTTSSTKSLITVFKEHGVNVHLNAIGIAGVSEGNEKIVSEKMYAPLLYYKQSQKWLHYDPANQNTVIMTPPSFGLSEVDTSHCYVSKNVQPTTREQLFVRQNNFCIYHDVGEMQRLSECMLDTQVDSINDRAPAAGLISENKNP